MFPSLETLKIMKPVNNFGIELSGDVTKSGDLDYDLKIRPYG
jgi:hypothetical protein